MKLLEMIGLPIYEVDTGKRIGRVQDFHVDARWDIEGIELEPRKLFSSTILMVPWHEIMACGEDAVMIKNKQAIQKKNAVDIQYTLMCGDHKLRDLPLLTPDGNQLGRVVDVYFDHNMGNTIRGLEITDGFISDLIEGRKWLRVTDVLTIGQDAIMVPVDSEQRLEKIITSVNG
ncbi:photosystem reaction center subunit H [Paenibacillus selenitireducens]|uniref:Photosystem reaction center subunit H n=1 Tax=Paenibacillus selenitireducens TaxID=1324314 RepID=A0A1T2XKN0_9BACL|nr:PRC-barrel domain-containing protein [Paenibacillus selenitireducens]OPA80414.1 photosystem reaction center subunit H [Paenibacillus selenitireducens]